MQDLNFWLQVWQLAVVPIVLALIAIIIQIVIRSYEIKKIHEEKRVAFVLQTNKEILDYFNSFLAILNSLSFICLNFKLTRELKGIESPILAEDNLFKVSSDYRSLYLKESAFFIHQLPAFVKAIQASQKLLDEPTTPLNQEKSISEFIDDLALTVTEVISSLGTILTHLLQTSEKLKIITHNQFDALNQLNVIQKDHLVSLGSKALALRIEARY